MSLKKGSKEKNDGRIRQIKEVLNNPSTLIPDCMDKGFLCPFSSYEKKLTGSVDLDKFSKSHDEFLRGLSETERALKGESPSFSFLAKTPHGSVTYMRKGDTDQFVLAGIQNSKNDIFRMLSFSRLVSSGKAIIYSAGGYYRASCKHSPPERKFIENALNEEGISFSINESGLIQIGNDLENFVVSLLGVPFLSVGSQSKVSTVFRIVKYMLARNPPALFSFDIPLLEQYKERGEDEIFSNYVLGTLIDSEFFNHIMKRRTASAKQSGAFLIGKEHFPDIHAFLATIDITPEQRDAITTLWPAKEGIFIEDNSPRKLFETVWPDIGEEFLGMLFPEIPEQTAHKIKGNPVEIIERLGREMNLERVRKSMNLSPWSPVSKDLAELIVIGKSEGKDALEDYISKMSMKESDSQAIVFCMQEIYGLNKNQSWKISSDAEVKGRLIAPLVKEVLNSEDGKAVEKFEEISKVIR